MARAGLNKYLVEKARDSILARGQRPTIDGIRIELGNTGSRTTIHKYLKELEEEEGARLDDVGLLSQTLQEMVGRLAARLHEEASDLAEQAATRYEARIRELETANEELLHTLTQAEAGRQAVQDRWAAEQGAHATTTIALEAERVRLRGLEEQIKGLEALVKEGEIHRQSLEQKHQHSRESLEHYRQSVKEQRDQDQRRHEAQLQQAQTEVRLLQQSLAVKQGEITQLNHDNGSLVTERRELQHQVRIQEKNAGQLEQALQNSQDTLKRTESLADAFRADLNTLREREQQLLTQLSHEAHSHQEALRSLTHVQTELNAARQAASS